MNDFRFVTIGSRPTLTPSELMSLVNPTGAQDYFVDLNRSVSGDGLTWDTGFNLISEAIAASNASIGLAANRWWARRNRIFVCGDGITEDLTVLPEKCDIIGVGSDLYPFPRVIGHHVIAVNKVGSRLINMGFQSTGAGPTITLPAGCHGFQMLGGLLIPTVTGSTKGIMITDSACVRIAEVRIVPNAGNPAVGIFAAAISIEGTVGHEMEIYGNKINATVGIHVAAGDACAGSLMEENIIHATGLTINDESLKFQVVNNRLMTDIDIDADTTLGIVCAPELACGNIVTGSGTAGTADTYPWAKIAA